MLKMATKQKIIHMYKEYLLKLCFVKNLQLNLYLYGIIN